MEAKDNFIFHLSWANILNECSPEIRLKVYDATVAYAQGNEIGELEPLAKMAFMFIKNDIDIDIDKYKKTCERNKINGLRGGRPKKPSGFLETEGFFENPTKPKKADNDNEYDNDNDNDLLSTNYQDNSMSASPTNNIPWNEIVDFFNKTTNGYLGKIRLPFSDKRKASVRARINDYGLETFYDVIRKAAASRFLTGDNKQNWAANFDWIIRPTNFEKVMSGNYDNKNEDTESGFEERREKARREAQNNYQPVTWENS
jgi:hypothetical protein